MTTAKSIYTFITFLLVATMYISCCIPLQQRNLDAVPTDTTDATDATNTPDVSLLLEKCSRHPEGALIERDTVVSLYKKGGFGFSHHAAIYYLSEEDDCFTIWRARLIASLKSHSEVEFTYTDIGQRITSVVAP